MVWAALIALLLTLAAYPALGRPFVHGIESIDGAYRDAVNYFFVHGLQIGKDVYFTYGPLGFLTFPQAIGANLTIAEIVLPVAKWAMLFAFVALAFRLPENQTLARRAMVVAIAGALAFLITHFGHWCALVAILAVLWHHETNRRWFLAAAVVAAALAILVKMVYAAIAIAALAAYGLWLLVDRRWQEALIIACGLPMSLAVGWLALFADVAGLPGYFLSSVEFAKGNASAMVAPIANNWWMLSAAAALLLLTPFLLRQRKAWLIYALCLPSLPLIFKYAFSRQDHQIFFTYSLAVMAGLLLIYQAGKRYWTAASLMAAVVLLVNFQSSETALSAGFMKFWVKSQVERSAAYMRMALIERRPYAAMLAHHSDPALAQALLGEPLRGRLAEHAVDVYPWDGGYVTANHLNWRPRPVPLSYVAYTPWLDARNAEHLRKESRPRYILWDLAAWKPETASIDRRYLLSDEPLTLLEMLSRYRFAGRYGGIALFEDTGSDNLSAVDGDEQTVRWDAWVPVPAHGEREVVRARLGTAYTPIGLLRRTLFRDDTFAVEYRLKSGKVVHHRLALDNAVSGVWVAPYVEAIRPGRHAEVVAVRFLSSPFNQMRPELTLRWEYLRPTPGAAGAAGLLPAQSPASSASPLPSK